MAPEEPDFKSEKDDKKPEHSLRKPTFSTPRAPENPPPSFCEDSLRSFMETAKCPQNVVVDRGGNEQGDSDYPGLGYMTDEAARAILVSRLQQVKPDCPGSHHVHHHHHGMGPPLKCHGQAAIGCAAVENCHEPVRDRTAPACFTLNNIRGTKAADCHGGTASHEHLLLSEQEVWIAQGVGLIPVESGQGTRRGSRMAGKKRDSLERKKMLVDDACCESSTDDEWPTVNVYKDSTGNPKRKPKKK